MAMFIYSNVHTLNLKGLSKTKTNRDNWGGVEMGGLGGQNHLEHNDEIRVLKNFILGEIFFRYESQYNPCDYYYYYLCFYHYL